MGDKEALRRLIWKKMEDLGVTRFPKPVEGRIPNFQGSERAASNLVEQPEFKGAKVVKVNPDAPQAPVRRHVLLQEKLLVMPSPRLRRGFMLLDPGKIPRRFLDNASTIKGAFKHGRACSIKSLPYIDLMVAGSVGVSRDGVRVGKGKGYSDMEYGILRELGSIDDETPIFTTIHDVQIVENAMKNSHDFVVDVIITPTTVIRIRRKHSQPRGILWDKISEKQLNNIPSLRELKRSKIE